MTPLDWFKKEKPLLGLLGSGGGASIGAATFEPITVRYILIGGGGAGGPGQGGGGGGAGAVRYAQLEIDGGVDHPYQVGGGGAPFPFNASGPVPANADGDQSWFTSPTITAGFGGGGGIQGAGPVGDEDHGRPGGNLGGGGGGGGVKDYTAASIGGWSGDVTAHPEINHPQGSVYGGGNGFAGPGGGSGNRGGGGAGSGANGGSAQHGGPVNGGPTQNPGARQVGGEGGAGFEMPGTYLPNDARPHMTNLQPTAYGWFGYSTSIPNPENFLGMRIPTVPQTYQNYFGGGGGGGSEREYGGNGGSGPDFSTNGNYGGGGNGAGANGYNLPQTGGTGAPGLNGRGGGGGGGGPDSAYTGVAPAPDQPSTNVGQSGGSGVLIIQYPKARTISVSQPTYTNIITSAPTPVGHDYFIAIGPAGPTKAFSFPHPGQGTVRFE